MRFDCSRSMDEGHRFLHKSKYMTNSYLWFVTYAYPAQLPRYKLIRCEGVEFKLENNVLTLVWVPNRGTPFEFCRQTYQAKVETFSYFSAKTAWSNSVVLSQYTLVTDDYDNRQHITTIAECRTLHCYWMRSDKMVDGQRLPQSANSHSSLIVFVHGLYGTVFLSSGSRAFIYKFRWNLLFVSYNIKTCGNTWTVLCFVDNLCFTMFSCSLYRHSAPWFYCINLRYATAIQLFSGKSVTINLTRIFTLVDVRYVNGPECTNTNSFVRFNFLIMMGIPWVTDFPTVCSSAHVTPIFPRWDLGFSNMAD